MNIRLLNANEIECRVQTVKKNGCSVLLYKDARCDMRILDETFGVLGWQRSHELINGNLFCNVSVWDDSKEQWIIKQDVGTESNTEKEKGQASDSFKRACFNLGIGRELYTAPFVWITLGENDLKESKGKYYPTITFEVKEIGYNDNKEIDRLVIVDSRGAERYRLGAKQPINKNSNNSTTQQNVLSEAQIKRLYAIGKKAGRSQEKVQEEVFKKYQCKPLELSKQQYDAVCTGYEKLGGANGN